MELNKNENTTQQNLWDIVKAVIWEKFINLSAYIKKSERVELKSWINKNKSNSNPGDSKK